MKTLIFIFGALLGWSTIIAAVSYQWVSLEKEEPDLIVPWHYCIAVGPFSSVCSNDREIISALEKAAKGLEEGSQYQDKGTPM